MDSESNINDTRPPGAALQAKRARVRKVCEYCGGEYVGLQISKYCSKQHQRLAINHRQYAKIATPESERTSARVYKRNPITKSTVPDGIEPPAKQPLRPIAESGPGES